MTGLFMSTSCHLTVLKSDPKVFLENTQTL